MKSYNKRTVIDLTCPVGNTNQRMGQKRTFGYIPKARSGAEEE
jgi:hypothetical protein